MSWDSLPEDVVQLVLRMRRDLVLEVATERLRAQPPSQTDPSSVQEVRLACVRAGKRALAAKCDDALSTCEVWSRIYN